jgi:hypothetical protein
MGVVNFRSGCPIKENILTILFACELVEGYRKRTPCELLIIMLPAFAVEQPNVMIVSNKRAGNSSFRNLTLPTRVREAAAPPK